MRPPFRVARVRGSRLFYSFTVTLGAVLTHAKAAFHRYNTISRQKKRQSMRKEKFKNHDIPKYVCLDVH